jgi:endonuclease YncB( thermonuclease family)
VGIFRALLFIVLVSVTEAASISGKVVGISDGDTLTILTLTKEQVKVRLHGIDAPESKQAFGNRAKQELSTLAFGSSRASRSSRRIAMAALSVACSSALST